MIGRVLLNGGRNTVKNSLQNNIKYGFGSYYQMVKMFSEVEQLPGNKDKLAKIKQYKSNLSEQDRQQFNHLMTWYSKKQPIRISTKVVNKYYLNNYVEPELHGIVDNELAEGAVMRRLSKRDEQSQLTLYDVNIFLRYLCTLEGNGAQKQKARKVVMFGENVSVLQGIFLLKLIEKRLTIGAGSKTFSKADRKQSEKQQQRQQKVKKPRKKKEKKTQQPVQ